LFLHFAHEAISGAPSAEAVYEGPEYDNAKSAFEKARRHIESVIDIKHVVPTSDLHGHKIGASEKEREYRRWCLGNGLFLNPLNDLGSYSICARDTLMLPNFVTAIEEPPTLLGFFNHMKQEFVSARCLLYEGSRSTRVHFADRKVALYNTLDYPAYSLGVERVKAAYRMAYSLFDKTGFFINAYMRLGIAASKVYFRSIWWARENSRTPVLRPEFEPSENWPLRGLCWLAKDLFDDSFREATEPDTQALYEIRNHLEHSYLKVHEMLVPPPVDRKSPSVWWIDELAYSVQRQDFEAKTLSAAETGAGSVDLFVACHAC
jgi:hypothetical protein